MRAGSAQIRYSNNIESRNIWQRIIEMFSAWIFRLLFICVFLIFAVSFGIFYHQGCEGWTSRMPVPAKSRSVHRSCQYPHPLQTVRGHLQRTDDIHPDLQIPRILFLPGASARFSGLRKRRAGNGDGKKTVFCHMSCLTDIKLDAGSLLRELIRAFASGKYFVFRFYDLVADFIA